MSSNVSKVRDYSKSIIYKLCCKNPNITEIYVGSTTNFIKRKYKHKSDCNNNSETNKKYNYYVYKFIRDNGGWDNWSMIQIIECSCENKKQLESKERYYIELLKSSLNGKIPTRTDREYREDNKNKMKEYLKEWRLENKDKVKERKKESYLENKDKILEYQKQKVNCDICNSIVNRTNLARHKKTDKCIKFQELIESK